MSRKIKDIRGQTFGKLIVTDNDPIRRKGQTYWKCRCICGNEKYIFVGNLRSGATVNCGCLEKKRYCKTKYKRLIRILNHMKQRCYNVKNPNYKHYGARGIKICDEWLNDSRKFYKWAEENGYNDSLTIDRIDVNGNYEPRNCRWTTMKIQENNRTNNRKITLNGETKTVSQWAEEYGITHEGFMWRYRHNKVN